MGFRYTTRAGHPTFVDLPWEQPLAEWHTERLVAPTRRAVVGFPLAFIRPDPSA